MKKTASHILMVLLGLVFCCNLGIEAAGQMTADELLFNLPAMVTAFSGEQRLDFSTEGDATNMLCDFVQSDTTTAVWHWSDGTTTAAVSGEEAVKTGLGAGAHSHYLIISSGSALTRFGAGIAGEGHLTAMSGFDHTPSLLVIYAYQESGLTSLGRTNNTLTREYHLWGTGLSPLAMDRVFADAVTSNVWNGTIWYPNSGTAASEIDRGILLARGWSLNSN